MASTLKQLIEQAKRETDRWTHERREDVEQAIKMLNWKSPNAQKKLLFDTLFM